MSKYRLGIMSSVWSVDAPDVDVAVMALRLWGGYEIVPIVSYTGEHQSRFMNLLSITDTSSIEQFIEEHAKDIQAAAKTIEEES